MNKIKAIIFDLGGVVLKHSYEQTTDLLAKPFNVVKDQVIKLFGELEDDWRLGKINKRHVAQKFKNIFTSPKSIDQIVEHWHQAHAQTANINRDVLAVVDSLRKSYQVYLLTNTNDLHFEAIATTGVLNHFDKIFASFEIGKQKPNRDIYEHFLKDAGLKGRECIFIDDREENLAQARKLGIKTILFKDFKSLINQLQRHKVKL